jgi:hypothetical protein
MSQQQDQPHLIADEQPLINNDTAPTPVETPLELQVEQEVVANQIPLTPGNSQQEPTQIPLEVQVVQEVVANSIPLTPGNSQQEPTHIAPSEDVQIENVIVNSEIVQNSEAIVQEELPSEKRVRDETFDTLPEGESPQKFKKLDEESSSQHEVTVV